ncbi:MAG: UvrD-helicase domain-containing protein, partial [Oscillospiraceae bacterium]|nr:UvrD-helicase domain-containing protein [Oscillospiraceae bacterium]
LVDTVGAGRDDGRLGALVLNLHGKMQSHAYPEVWAEEQRRALYAEGITDPGETVWGRYLLDSAAETADYWARIMEGMLGEMSHPDYDYIAAKYADNFAETAEGLRSFAAAAKLGWERAAEHSDIPFPRLNSPRKPAHPEVLERFKAHRAACKDAVKGFKTEFGQSGKEILADMRKTAPAMEALLELTLEFDKVFAKEKKRRGLVDYGDLEHFAARLLSEPDGSPTALAVQISERYTEIMVDEYQDVSAVQELIFRSVSKRSANLFTVGDVKQSIYRFRLADPTIFTEKYLTYYDYENAPKGAPRRILLQENFRSRDRILDAANSVFENIMSTQLGELEYDENARLRCGARYEGNVPVPMLCLINGNLDVEDDSATLQDVEADFVAESIRRIIDEKTPVRDGDGTRPARYGDIAILMRSANAVGGVYRRALMNHEIPVQSEQGGGFWQRSEVTDLLALLAVTDNPMQDVPLITALRSVYVGFTPDELAQIRAADKKGCYYDALCKSAKIMPKAAAFLEKLNCWRVVSADLPMGELVLRIMDDLDMSAVTSAMSDGQMRLRNVTAFAELAVKFEETGWQGLRRFVVWLQRQMENKLEPEVACGGGDAVQIMSIHKSKGLEFPIVFLCDTARRFNKMDSMETVLVHPQMGLGPKVVDNERGIEYYSMPRRALVRKLNRETLSEEMRLLYVAMTRPKEYLFMTGVLKDAEKTVEKLRPLVTAPVSPQVLEGESAMVNWLIAAVLADGGRHIQMNIIDHVILADGAEGREKTAELPPADEALVDRIRENLAYRYPNEDSVFLPSKLTATELKYLEERDE